MKPPTRRRSVLIFALILANLMLFLLIQLSRRQHNGPNTQETSQACPSVVLLFSEYESWQNELEKTIEGWTQAFPHATVSVRQVSSSLKRGITGRGAQQGTIVSSNRSSPEDSGSVKPIFSSLFVGVRTGRRYQFRAY